MVPKETLLIIRCCNICKIKIKRCNCNWWLMDKFQILEKQEKVQAIQSRRAVTFVLRWVRMESTSYRWGSLHNLIWRNLLPLRQVAFVRKSRVIFIEKGYMCIIIWETRISDMFQGRKWVRALSIVHRDKWLRWGVLEHIGHK